VGAWVAGIICGKFPNLQGVDRLMQGTDPGNKCRGIAAKIRGDSGLGVVTLHMQYLLSAVYYFFSVHESGQFAWLSLWGHRGRA